MALRKRNRIYRVTIVSFGGKVVVFMFAPSKEEAARRLQGKFFSGAIKRVEGLKWFKWK